MKKIFVIISSVFMSLIVAFLAVICFVKINLKVEIGGEPISISVYNKSVNTTKCVDGIYKAYTKEDENYSKILENFSEITNLSIFSWLMNNNNLHNDVEMRAPSTSFNADTLKRNYIVVEMIYTKTQNIIIQQDGNQRVIPYVALFVVINPNKSFSTIDVYYSRTSGEQERLNQYASTDNIPLHFKGDVSNFVKFVNLL